MDNAMSRFCATVRIAAHESKRLLIGFFAQVLNNRIASVTSRGARVEPLAQHTGFLAGVTR
jgi:hypothetical protein